MNLNRRDLAGEPGARGAATHIEHAEQNRDEKKQGDGEEHQFAESDPQDGKRKGCSERSPAAERRHQAIPRAPGTPTRSLVLSMIV